MIFKKIFLYVLSANIFIMAKAQQLTDYNKEWKKVENLEAKGLTKDAKNEVLNLIIVAAKEKNDAQQVKGSMYLIKYRNMVEEDSHENNIFYVDTLIEKTAAPAKNMLQSLQAQMFWQYLQNNRWKFYNRTKLEQEKSKDITTWSIDRIHKQISTLYKASITNEAILKTTKLENYDAIIIKGENTRQLRPTLYDFLAHRALQYFMTDENDITKPAYAFVVKDEKAFAPVSEFINYLFKTKDTASLKFKAILLLQDVLKFHLNDANKDALLDADMIRLGYINSIGVFGNKEKLYEQALLNMEEKYAGNHASAQAMYLRALIYKGRGDNYEANGKADNQYEIKRAKELCDKIVATYSKTEGGINAQNLLNQIQQPGLDIKTERVNLINQPFRNLVDYKNIKKLYLRIVKTTNEEIKKIETSDDYLKKWEKYTTLKATKNWEQTLPDLNDYQFHSVEIKADGLQNGVYLLIASITPDFAVSKNVLALQKFYVSNIAYIGSNENYNTKKPENAYYILNRETGQPFAAATVQVWEHSYNYDRREYVNTKGELLTADKDGMIKVREAKQNEYRQINLQVKYNNDELYMDDYMGISPYNAYEQPIKPNTFLFTDRSIYRPGQTIYFKGIVLQKEKDASKSAVVPSYKSKVILRDANYQKVSELEVTTNEYGSYKGSFVLPQGGLTGQFSILDEKTNGQQAFNVEEYKRPKFFTEIPKPKGTYRINDSIKVTGTAKAYAGNNVDGANVKYRVVRKVQYPIWWEWGWFRGRGRGYNGSNQEMEITNGETKTNSKGEFNITFKAIPDESIDKANQPTFYYEVNADVTDINGETRSGNTSVAVAYQALKLNIVMPETMKADSLKKLIITSTNINDVFEKAKVNVAIYKVKAPNKMFRERYWEMPDQFVMSKDEYYGYFPNDLYKDEDSKTSWAIGDRELEQTDTTKESGQWTIAHSPLQAGWYKIIATTKDKYGEDVKAEHFIKLTQTGNDFDLEPITIDVKKTNAEPGENIDYTIKSSFNKIWLVHTLNKMNAKSERNLLELNSLKSFSNIITEADRGGMNMNYIFVKNNRIYKGMKQFYVPWNNKELDITFASFRDKLLPGANEKYSIKISGSKGEKLSAEMLATMYDASLDQFKPHYWQSLNIWPSMFNYDNWNGYGFNMIFSEELNKIEFEYREHLKKSYDYLGVKKTNKEIEPLWWLNSFVILSHLEGRVPGVNVRSAAALKVQNEESQFAGSVIQHDMNSDIRFDMNTKGNSISEKKLESDENGNLKYVAIKSESQNEGVQIRKNFNETAFFLPDLKTDADGNVELSYTIPEALTEWKLMLLAHTKDLKSGMSTKKVITQKPLMIQPNAPRFMREGDKIEFSAKVVNLTDKEVTGTAVLELLDAATGKPVDGWFKNMFPTQYFTAPAGQSFAVKFPMEIPFNYNSALTYRIVAKADGASDGEEMSLPVLTNRMMVTETMPINMRGNVTIKNFKFEKLLQSSNSSTLSNHALTIEYTSNPAWYAVQALPYLMEYPYECAEQTFNRFYANTLASYITKAMPKIKTIFEKWKTADTAALLSNLQKNEELKSALLQETPWVMEAQNESQQKKKIALLFDMVKMSKEQEKAFTKLKEMQSSNGGFTWFKGGPDDRYITQYIVTGIGHLRKLNALSGDNYNTFKSIIDKAVPYLDMMLKKDYDDLIRYKAKLANNNTGFTQIQCLYMRSFFKEYGIAKASQTAVDYYTGQIKKYWLQNSKYMQGMIALALHRSNDAKTPKAIIESLKQNAISKEEMGMYWKDWANGGGYYWHQAPIESQAMMVEVFTDIDKNTTTIDDIKTWLLKQKQTQNWKTTKATAEACYALLLGGSNWLSEEKEVSVSLSNIVINSTDNATEAGTGYFKKRIDGEKVKAEMGNINVAIKQSKNSTGTTWGSVYWQYFEDLDKITSAETPLKLKKQLFIETNTDKGPVLKALADGAELKVGDKVKVRIELKVDRDMEYVHMKDMRAACMEPVNVLSEYKWQGGLGYYESTKDASTNFFFSWLNRGTYIFEYPMFVTHSGNFSNGITTIQCMYAPEFSSHSEGIRVNVEEN